MPGERVEVHLGQHARSKHAQDKGQGDDGDVPEGVFDVLKEGEQDDGEHGEGQDSHAALGNDIVALVDDDGDRGDVCRRHEVDNH